MAMFSFFRAWCPVVLATGRLHRLCSIYTPAEGTSLMGSDVTTACSWPQLPEAVLVVMMAGGLSRLLGGGAQQLGLRPRRWNRSGLDLACNIEQAWCERA